MVPIEPFQQSNVAARAPAAPKPAAAVDPAVAAAEKRERIKRMLAEAEAGADKPTRQPLAAAIFAPAALVLSGKVRFLLGCLLLVGCALWAKQNDLARRHAACWNRPRRDGPRVWAKCSMSLVRQKFDYDRRHGY